MGLVRFPTFLTSFCVKKAKVATFLEDFLIAKGNMDAARVENPINLEANDESGASVIGIYLKDRFRFAKSSHVKTTKTWYDQTRPRKYWEKYGFAKS